MRRGGGHRVQRLCLILLWAACSAVLGRPRFASLLLLLRPSLDLTPPLRAADTATAAITAITGTTTFVATIDLARGTTVVGGALTATAGALSSAPPKGRWRLRASALLLLVLSITWVAITIRTRQPTSMMFAFQTERAARVLLGSRARDVPER